MELRVKQKDGKYRFWCTMEDEWISEWLDRDGALRFLYKREYSRSQIQFQLQYIKTFLRFPQGFLKMKGDETWTNPDGCSEHKTWVGEVNEKGVDEVYEFVENRFTGILSELGLDKVDMRRYVLFGFDAYESAGGLRDIMGTVDDITDCDPLTFDPPGLARQYYQALDIENGDIYIWEQARGDPHGTWVLEGNLSEYRKLGEGKQ